MLPNWMERMKKKICQLFQRTMMTMIIIIMMEMILFTLYRYGHLSKYNQTSLIQSLILYNQEQGKKQLEKSDFKIFESKKKKKNFISLGYSQQQKKIDPPGNIHMMMVNCGTTATTISQSSKLSLLVSKNKWDWRQIEWFSFFFVSVSLSLSLSSHQ